MFLTDKQLKISTILFYILYFVYNWKLPDTVGLSPCLKGCYALLFLLNTDSNLLLFTSNKNSCKSSQADRQVIIFAFLILLCANSQLITSDPRL